MHKDKFGREWKFTPHHNTDRMIKIPTDVMERFIAADRLIVGPWPLRDYFHQPVECYVLRLAHLGICTGARYSDDGPDYYSSLLHQDFMVMQLLRYTHKHCDIKNHAALLEVFSDQLGEIL